jgi:23S rRNA pseudouridine1911/1915/1917 synthase
MSQEQNNFVVPEEWDGERLDRFLVEQNKEQSRGYFQKLIAQSFVLLNDKTVTKPSILVKTGEIIRVVGEIADQALPLAEKSALDIVYEDEDILVINKSADITVHPTANRSTGTLVNSLLYHSISIADAVYDVHSLVSKLRPGIVHRLDKDTSGIMVVAKTKEALMNLANQFREHTVTKKYSALLYGKVTEPTTIEMNIRRKPSSRNMMSVSTKPEEGRSAITHITPQKEYNWRVTEEDVTLVECEIETGRTHQIRVHCKYFGHPVVGDPVYSNKPAKKFSETLGVQRQMLHAHSLTIKHPRTGEECTFVAPLPADFEKLLTKLERP